MSPQPNSLIEAAEQAVTSTNQIKIFTSDEDYFSKKYKMALELSQSTLIPHAYNGKASDVMIAMELSEQMKLPLFVVTQNLDIIHGKAGWKSTFVISIINTSGRYSNKLKFEFKGKENSDDWSCRAYIKEHDDSILYGTWISIAMAKAEGWYEKKGSKWKTMPEQMLQYRAASFFGRLYVSDLLMGMQTVEEIIDVSPLSIETINKANELSIEPVELAVAVVEKEIKQKIIEPVKKSENVQIEEDIKEVDDVSDIVQMKSFKELKETLSLFGFKIIEKKQTPKGKVWVKIIADDDEADFEMIVNIKGITKKTEKDNFFVMEVSELTD